MVSRLGCGEGALMRTNHRPASKGGGGRGAPVISQFPCAAQLASNCRIMLPRILRGPVRAKPHGSVRAGSGERVGAKNLRQWGDLAQRRDPVSGACPQDRQRSSDNRLSCHRRMRSLRNVARALADEPAGAPSKSEGCTNQCSRHRTKWARQTRRITLWRKSES